MVIKGSKWLFIESLRQILWLLSTGSTNFEILILVLTLLLLKVGQKRTKFAYLVRKVTEGLKWCQNETKLISNTNCSRKIKTRFIWTFRKNVPDFSWFQYFYSQLYIIYKFESFWPSFEIIASQNGARISKFQENYFIIEYLTPKFLLLLISIFLSPLVHEIQVSVLFRANFRLMTSQG